MRSSNTNQSGVRGNRNGQRGSGARAFWVEGGIASHRRKEERRNDDDCFSFEILRLRCSILSLLILAPRTANLPIPIGESQEKTAHLPMTSGRAGMRQRMPRERATEAGTPREKASPSPFLRAASPPPPPPGWPRSSTPPSVALFSRSTPDPANEEIEPETRDPGGERECKGSGSLGAGRRFCVCRTNDDERRQTSTSEERKKNGGPRTKKSCLFPLRRAALCPARFPSHSPVTSETRCLAALRGENGGFRGRGQG